MMKIKKINIISLMCILCFTFLPINLYALENSIGDSTNSDEIQNYTYSSDTLYDLRNYTPEKDKKSKKNTITPYSSSVCKDKLNTNEQKVYNELLKGIKAAACGNTDVTSIQIPASEFYPKKVYTKEELGVSTLVTGNQMSDELYNKLLEVSNIDSTKVLTALLYDCPFDLYWFNKTHTWVNPDINFKINEDTNEVLIDETTVFVYKLNVVPEYNKTGAAESIDIDDNKAKLTYATTEKKAKEVIKEVTAKSKTHYDILNGYLNWINDNITYNKAANEALLNNTAVYGNPWQIIWVFDDDPNTNVICEGYAKAFKYLCDETPELAADNIEAYLVTGELNFSGATTLKEPHMWNVVHMNNGKNYLVDCTNMDDMEWKTSNFLFMTGAPKETTTLNGAEADKYKFVDEIGTIEFTYDKDTMAHYTNAERDLDSVIYDAASSVEPSKTPENNNQNNDSNQNPSQNTDQNTNNNENTNPPTNNNNVDNNTDEDIIDEDIDDGGIDDADDDDVDKESDTSKKDINKDSDKKGIKTGDNTNMGMYAIVLFMSIILLSTLLIRRKITEN